MLLSPLAELLLVLGLLHICLELVVADLDLGLLLLLMASLLVAVLESLREAILWVLLRVKTPILAPTP